jgi:alpha-tubulin suppressor-like RCC1 family protein
LLKKFEKIKTSFNKNIGLTKNGEVYVWGLGPMGTGNVQKLDKPSHLELSNMPIRPTKLLATGSSFAMFVPCKFVSLNPKITFSKGGTLCNIVGRLFLYLC